MKYKIKIGALSALLGAILLGAISGVGFFCVVMLRISGFEFDDKSPIDLTMAIMIVLIMTVFFTSFFRKKEQTVFFAVYYISFLVSFLFFVFVWF
jgi:hypothetical protein